jgi:glycosyltransferase involved in cell wall biosynthesis
MKRERATVLIALTSLAAEGTPRMTLALCREWLSQGIRPIVVVLQAKPADLAPEFVTLGIECFVLGISQRGYRRYLVLAAKVFAIARRRKATALLSMPLGRHAVMAFGARMAGVRRVVAHVGNYPDSSTGRAFAKFRFLIQLGRPLTDRLICCSRYVQGGAIERFHVPARETAIVYNGVSGEDFIPRASTANDIGPRTTPFVIGMIARLEKHKDHVTLIRAAKILKDRGRSIAVKFVGEGSQRHALQQIVDADGLADTVTLLGMRRDIAAILAKLDVFAFSTTPDEGFGIALVEAMLAGVPIVASDVGACREVLDGGGLGLLVPARDALALANAVDAVLGAPVEAKTRAARAREKALRDYSVRAMARGYGEALGLPLIQELQCDAELAMGLPT